MKRALIGVSALALSVACTEGGRSVVLVDVSAGPSVTTAIDSVIVHVTRGGTSLHHADVNEPLPLKAPFRISGYTFDAMPATIVTLHDGDLEGRGEGAGVYYLDDHPEKMLATLEAMRDTIESGVTRTQLRSLLQLAIAGIQPLTAAANAGPASN